MKDFYRCHLGCEPPFGTFLLFYGGIWCSSSQLVWHEALYGWFLSTLTLKRWWISHLESKIQQACSDNLSDLNGLSSSTRQVDYTAPPMNYLARARPKGGRESNLISRRIIWLPLLSGSPIFFNSLKRWYCGNNDWCSWYELKFNELVGY